MSTPSLNTVPFPTGAQSDDQAVPSASKSGTSSDSEIAVCIDDEPSVPTDLPEPLAAMPPHPSTPTAQESNSGYLRVACALSPSNASALSDGGSPSKPRPLVRVVSKATGFVKVVAKRSIRRINRKSDAGEGEGVELEVAVPTEVAVHSEVVVEPEVHENSKATTQSEPAIQPEDEDEMQSESPHLVSSPIPQTGEWSGETAVPDVTVVVKEISDVVNDDLLKAPVDMKVHTSPTPLPLRTLNMLIHQNAYNLPPQPCDSVFSLRTPTGVWHVPVDPSRPQVSESTTSEEAFTPPHIEIEEAHAFGIIYTLQYGNPSDRDPHAAGTHQPPLVRALLFMLFVPWCVAVGGAILLAPASAGALAFRGGFVRGAAPPRGLRRLAYWADNAYEHVFVFLAVAAVALFYADPRRAVWVLAAAVVRIAWVWGGYRPGEGLHLRVGQNDQESLWLVAKGSGVMDMAVGSGKECSGEKNCECHERSVLRCPDSQVD
ncbi:hypothetical protein C8Q79DRAFT_1007554 [Trametes meyenii]|nr:hypothetical protein C8Q79DRAFT_1007554 [Trametes meyenii]